MAKNKNSKKLSWQLCKPVIASALAVGGVFNLVGIVLAEGTAAGTQITNTATATYRDPEGTPQTAVSNKVTVTVAEIAGITVKNISAQEATVDDGVVGPGEEAAYIFEITNVGNDETDISLPAVADFTGPVDRVVSIKADLDGSGNYATDITGRTDVENIAPGDSFKVQVIVEVSDGAKDDDKITVQYGDTAGDGQNQPYDSSGGSVFTDDNDQADRDNTGTASQTAEEAGPEAPANGEREASDTGEITIGEAPLQQPLVKLEKTVTAYSNATTANDISDDTITYGLKFEVSNTDANGDTAADLRPITISVDNNPVQRILVSDALPKGTTAGALTPSTDGGTWTAVYTESPVTTNALFAEWKTGTPADANAVTRVGFILDAAKIDKGTTIDGFSIVVNTDGRGVAADVPTTVANIAQVIGSGAQDDPLTSEDETLNFPVMDESGDQTPSNYDPDTETYSNFNPEAIDTSAPDKVHSGFTPGDGYIDDPSDLISTGASDTITSIDDTNIDPENLVSGTLNPGDDNPDDPNNKDGEAIVVQLAAPEVSDLLNGPNGSPDAVGPTSTDDDFTNKSAPFSEGNPPVVAFTNSVRNDSSEDGWVTLTPIAPATAADLPTGTKATIIAPDGTRTEFEYSVTGTTGTWTKNTGPDVIVPIRKKDSTVGPDNFDYGVEVDLPGTGVVEQASYPVPINAQFDSAADGQDGNYVADNVTIDRVYTGFLKLVKTAQVVRGDGPPVSGNPAPGNHIRYRVTYSNISEAEAGSMQGNVLLTASDLAIIEDGTARACDYGPLVDDNNWALDNDNGDGDNNYGTDLDTRHVPGSVDVTNLDQGSTGSVAFFNGGPACDNANKPNFSPAGATATTELSGTTYNTDSTKYVFNIDGDIEPLESGYVEFERRIN